MSVYELENADPESIQIQEAIEYPILEDIREPCECQCPYCDSKITTQIITKYSQMDYLLLFIGFFCCAFPLIFYVLLCSDWRDVKHYCTKCNAYLGSA